MIIGIDPGKEGAIVALMENREIVVATPMPVIRSTKGRDTIDVATCVAVIDKLKRWAPLAYVEKGQPLPPKMGGGIANFSRGYGVGLWEGILRSLGIGYTLVPPARWQKAMLADTSGDTKSRALQIFHRLGFNTAVLMVGRKTKPHDGIVDAALIAEWGRRSEGLG